MNLHTLAANVKTSTTSFATIRAAVEALLQALEALRVTMYVEFRFWEIGQSPPNDEALLDATNKVNLDVGTLIAAAEENVHVKGVLRILLTQEFAQRLRALEDEAKRRNASIDEMEKGLSKVLRDMKLVGLHQNGWLHASDQKFITEEFMSKREAFLKELRLIA